jgi:hypothetical protein
MLARGCLPLILVSVALLPACDGSVNLGRKRDLVPTMDAGDGGETPANEDVAPPPPDLADDEIAPMADTGAEAADVTADLGPAETEPTDVPAAGILWSSNAESGDFSDWQRGGAIQGGTYQQMTTVMVADQQAHSGTRAYRINFDSSNDQDHMAEFYRRVETAPAYYSAWFYIPEAHAPTTFWTVLYFFYQLQPGTAFSRRGLWDINLNRQSAYFFDETSRRQVDAQPRKPYPIAQWFHLEAYFSYEGRNGHIRVWLDGEQILDVPNLGAAPSDDLYWGVGSDTDGLTPAGCTLYVDDAAISTSRVGP